MDQRLAVFVFGGRRVESAKVPRMDGFAARAPVAQQVAQPTCNRQVSGFESPLGLRI